MTNKEDQRLPLQVLALDLEATLVSNAYTMIPRPGLGAFLQFCDESFQRVAIYTTVEESDAREVMNELASLHLLPNALLDRLEYVDWQGEYKDLNFVQNATPEQIVLVDDDEHWIRPDQQRWIRVLPWHGEEVERLEGEPPDAELARVQQIREAML